MSKMKCPKKSDTFWGIFIIRKRNIPFSYKINNFKAPYPVLCLSASVSYQALYL